jgi:hypothetical protein
MGLRRSVGVGLGGSGDFLKAAGSVVYPARIKWTWRTLRRTCRMRRQRIKRSGTDVGGERLEKKRAATPERSDVSGSRGV